MTATGVAFNQKNKVLPHLGSDRTKPDAYLAFVGLIAPEDLKEMGEIIESDCERIEWHLNY